METIIHIGKKGLTEEILEHIKKVVKQKKIVKVKIVSELMKKTDKKEFAKELAEKTNTILKKQVGFTVELKKKV